jgi:excisionase family DNA binding protein
MPAADCHDEGRAPAHEPEPASLIAGPEVPGDLLLLTIEQVARLLQISRSGLYALLRADGGPRAVKLGSLTRIARVDLERYVDRLREQADAPAGTGGGAEGAVDQLVEHVVPAAGTDG